MTVTIRARSLGLLRGTTLLAVLVVGGGCPRGNSANPARDAWLLACHAQEHVPAGSTNIEIVRWIEANVHHPSVREAFGSVAQPAPVDKATLLRNAAARAGVTDCPLVDALWARRGSPVPEIGR